MRPFGPFPKEHSGNRWSRISPPTRVRPNYHIHILLFLMTVVTTVVAGMWSFEGLNPLQHPREFYRGFPYAGTLLTILFCHEMGHYLTARYYGMDVTLPYFLPVPPPLSFLGTLGAFIRMKSPLRHRRALLYVAAAGPIAGFCVALPAVIYAYATSTVAPLSTSEGSIYFGESLLLQLVGYLIVGPIPQGFALHINSVGVAAWFGILVTMLNLLPIGQLDGGHIVHALLGPKARYVFWPTIGVLFIMGVTLLIRGQSFGVGWFFWAFFGWLTTLRKPTILDQHTPLNRRSKIIAGIAFVIFVLCFMPVPLSL
jgi:membrane-associated protease RseP (regulator of RpoE activity)